MKELDFDELDKAVNSLMGGVAKKSTQPATKTQDGDTILDISGTKPEASSNLFMNSMPEMSATPTKDESSASAATVTPPKEDTTNVVDEKPAASTPVAEVIAEPGSLASRRSGRFMDVHHPSSDMKNPLNSPSASPTRRGVTIAAPAREVIEEPVSEPVDTTVEAPALIDAAEPQQNEEWPDPLAGFEPEPATMSEEATKVESAEEMEAASTPEVQDESELSNILDKEIEAIEDSPTEIEADESSLDSLTTPFLVDAKVDKRPLGGVPAAATPPVSAPVALDSSAQPEDDIKGDEDDKPNRAPAFGAITDKATTGDPEDQLPPSAAETPDPVLPEELQGDLMAIESGSAEVHDLAATMTTEAEETTGVASSVAAAPVFATADTKKDTTPSPAGQSSIQPQYKEEASTGDQTNGSIYDTRGYHQPLEHPAKKKSGWLWIVWVIIILLVGAGSSAALYLLNII